MRRILLLGGIFFLFGQTRGTWGGEARSPAPRLQRSVLVEGVESGSLAARAGLRPGDRLTSWSRQASGWSSPFPAAGRLPDPFALLAAAEEQLPRGAVALYGEREGRPGSWSLQAGAAARDLGLRLQSALSPARQASGGSMADGGASTVPLDPGADRTSALWARREEALGFERERRFAAADGSFRAALDELATGGEWQAAAGLAGEWGRSLDRRRRWDEAAACHLRALRLLAPLPGAELARARAHHDLGEVFRHSDDYQGAEREHRRALAIRQAFAPESLDAAESHLALARVLLEAGLGDPLPSVRRAEELVSRIDSDGLLHSRVLDLLGMALSASGRSSEARQAYVQALAVAARGAPRSYEAGRALLHLAALVGRTGQEEEMEDLLLRALPIWRALPNDYLNRFNLSGTLIQLAYLRAGQWDLETAHEYSREAVEIREQLNPRSLGLAEALDVLGHSARLLERQGEARAAISRALALREELVPRSLTIPTGLAALAHIDVDAGENLPAAEALLRRALALLASANPESQGVANALLVLSQAAALQGRPREAVEVARRSLALRTKLMPESLEEAEALWVLARWERQAGERSAAAEHACAAAARVERRGEGWSDRWSWRIGVATGTSLFFADCVSARVAQGRLDEAFRVLEAGRGRALLDRLGESALRLADLPEELRQRRELLRQEARELNLELAGLSAATGQAETLRLQRRLIDNQAREEEISRLARQAGKERRTGSGLAPLGPEEVRRSLGRGTALLAYSVGEDESELFVIRGGRGRSGVLAVFHLGLGAEALRRRAEAFRRLAADPQADRPAQVRHGRALYELLVRPAERLLRRADRLLIVPDGPLHALPFAALVRSGGGYLGEWKPLHKAVSATFYVYARNLASARPSAERGEPLRLAAFGDATPPGARPAEGLPLGGGAGRQRAEGDALARLAASGDEVRNVASLFTRSRVFVGDEASERNARSAAGRFDVLHFATHALLDERFPGRSALVLSPPSAGAVSHLDDGRLEAREIVEEVRAPLRLVTLSACETALGREAGGEGLIGLTQAFELAGASSVLASLWPVGDDATARFLPTFYTYLRAGDSAIVALQKTQKHWLRSPGRERPFYWSAFELFGSPD